MFHPSRLLLWCILPSTQAFSFFRFPWVHCNVKRATSISFGGGFNFVEGDTFDETFSEIEAMGGDPSFLSQDDGNIEDKTSKKYDTSPSDLSILSLTEQQNGENLVEVDDTAKGDSDLRSREGLLATLSRASSHSASIDTISQKSTNSKHFETMGNEIDELEELESLGGDPFFLQDEALAGKGVAQTFDRARAAELAELEELGGDPFFLQDERPTKERQAPARDFDGVRAAELEELGGDPSFLQDEPLLKDKQIPSQGFGGISAAELEELGGDPFFLQDEPSLTEQQDSAIDLDGISAADLKEAGGDPSFLQNGPLKEKRGDILLRNSDAMARSELEELGGDPFFLHDEPSEEQYGSPSRVLREMARVRLEELGGDPFFLQDESLEEDSPLPGFRSRTATSTDKMARRAKELEEAGGDPFFLQEENESPAPSPDQDLEDDDYLWDGTVDEEAHLGLGE